MLNLPSGTFPNAEDENIPLGLRDTIQKRIIEDYYDLGFYIKAKRSKPRMKNGFFLPMHGLNIFL